METHKIVKQDKLNRKIKANTLFTKEKRLK